MTRGRDDEAAEGIGRAYDRYAPDLYRYALMILADREAAADTVQQVFLAVLRRPAGDVDDIERYLRRAVRNECYSALRSRRRERVSVVDAPILEAVAAAADRPDERIALNRAIRSLPPEQREVVHLKVFEGRTFQEIADLTGELANTIASRYRYAVEKMRAELGARS